MMINKALGGEPLSIYGKGDHLRDYIHINDVISAFILASVNMDRINGRYYVIGSGEGHTISQAANLVVSRVAMKTGHKVPVKHIDPPRPLHSIEFRNFIADFKLFSDSTLWKPNFSLVRGIDHTIHTLL